MEVHTAAWSVKQIKSMSEIGTILFDYPIQRSSDQWDLKKKSELIDSAIAGMPIPPLYFLRFYENRPNQSKPVPVRWVLDGKQRITTLVSYLRDEFALINTLAPVHVNGFEYDIAGKKFSELEEYVQDALLGKNIPHYTMDQDKTTDEEIELLFSRMNNGTALTVQQKAKGLIGIRFSTLLNNVSAHVAVLELSNFPYSSIKKNEHQAGIMQAMMILESFEHKGFSAKELTRYAEGFKSDFDNKVATLGKVEKALDYIVDTFPNKEKFLLKKISFPMTVALAYRAAEQGIEPDTFFMWATSFVDAVNGEETAIPTNYLEFTKSGSTDLRKVTGRIKEMNAHFEKYLEMVGITNQ